PKKHGGRHAPGGDIEDPQPPRHLLGIALGAETDAGEQAHAAVSPRMERYKDRHKAWSSKPLGRHQPIRQIRNASLSAKSPRPAPLRRVTTIATVSSLNSPLKSAQHAAAPFGQGVPVCRLRGPPPAGTFRWMVPR